MHTIALRYWRIDGPPDERWRWDTPRDAERVIERMAAWNACAIRSGHRLEPGKVRYVPEDGMEELLSAPLLEAVGYGDCEDVVAYQLGAMWSQGVKARARVEYVGTRSDGIDEYHAMIRLPDGTIEDPSAWM